MGILGWIVFGLVVGAIAKLLMPGRDPGGIIVTMVLGIVGALLGGFIGRALGMPIRPSGPDGTPLVSLVQVRPASLLFHIALPRPPPLKPQVARRRW